MRSPALDSGDRKSTQLGFLGFGCRTDLRRIGVGVPAGPVASPRCSPSFPAGSGTRMARSFRLARLLAELGLGTLGPQPPTFNHDDLSADCVGARLPRCSSTDLSHAATSSTTASCAGGSTVVRPRNTQPCCSGMCRQGAMPDLAESAPERACIGQELCTDVRRLACLRRSPGGPLRERDPHARQQLSQLLRFRPARSESSASSSELPPRHQAPGTLLVER